MPAGGEAAHLDAVYAKYIVRWPPVEYDWEELCERNGLTIIHSEVPGKTTELCATLFFVNAFVSERSWEEGAWEAMELENENK